MEALSEQKCANHLIVFSHNVRTSFLPVLGRFFGLKVELFLLKNHDKSIPYVERVFGCYFGVFLNKFYSFLEEETSKKIDVQRQRFGGEPAIRFSSRRAFCTVKTKV